MSERRIVYVNPRVFDALQKGSRATRSAGTTDAAGGGRGGAHRKPIDSEGLRKRLTTHKIILDALNKRCRLSLVDGAVPETN